MIWHDKEFLEQKIVGGNRKTTKKTTDFSTPVETEESRFAPQTIDNERVRSSINAALLQQFFFFKQNKTLKN